MNKSPILILCLLCPLASAQTGVFGGSPLLSRGTGGTGQRSGQDVDLKYFVSASLIHDTGLTPYGVGTNGQLAQTGALNGIELGFGAYGRHSFRRSALGLDYYGNYRHYPGSVIFDGSNQALTLEYTHQKSRRMLFDMNVGAGTQNFGTAIGSLGGLDSIVDSSSLLFDNRTSYLQTGMTMRYALSTRTTFSMGGVGYTVQRASSALVGVRGYSLSGSINHQLSRSTIIGLTYSHMHYDFPRAFGETDINSYQGTYSRDIGRWWNFSIAAGAFISQVQGVRSTALDPDIAALLGIGSVRTIFYLENVLPIASASFTRKFRRASITGNYARSITPGNGVFLTSRQESYGATYSYTGIRRLSFSASAGATQMDSLGQSLVPFKQIFGSVNANYRMGSGLNLGGNYSKRYQDLQNSSFPRDSSRISFTLSFSPGTVPISLR